MTFLGKLDVRVKAIDTESYSTLAEGEIVELRTSDYDEDWAVDPEGTEIFESDGITIKYLGAIEETMWPTFERRFYGEERR